ncbi:hypothetical protein [Bacillus paramycoides]|uniref:YhgE/Pip domain-containing protein n=1 Tax=Bacillus paramycoides TaxID=2026194 RepID=UPI002E237BEB|nr:hypothetical protein [Bacillus paramycoides]
MKSFLKFLKSEAVIIAFIMAIAYQVIVIGANIPGYSALPKNLDKLSVAIVNEDSNYGKTMTEQLQKVLPFKKVESLTLLEAKKELDERKLHLIIHIPNNLTEKMTTPGQKVNLDFYINEANPTMVSSAMKQVVSQTQEKINQMFSLEGTKGVIQKLNIPEEQAQQMATDISNKLKANVITSNNVPIGMHNQMAPLFLTMATYLVGLFAASQLATAFRQREESIGKWKGFFHIQAAGLIMAILSPIIGVSILYLSQGYGVSVFFQLWMHHSLQLLVALQFSLVIALLFGPIGMLINIGLLMFQVVASGAMMPREVMLLPYKIMTYISPMYYSVNTDFSLLFGGGNVTKTMLLLVLTGIVSFLINCIIIVFQKKDTKKNIATV